MSKNSQKQIHSQVVEWLPTVKIHQKNIVQTEKTQGFSKSDYYKEKR